MTVLQRIRSVVGPLGLVEDPQDQAAYLTDWLEKWHGRAALVVRPGTVAELAQVMALCHDTHTPVVTQGGNTGMSGGATPDASGAQIVLSTTRLNRIRQVDPVNQCMTVEAGVLLADVQGAAAQADLFFPLSLGSQGSCTIGGNLATNAGGVAVLRYGNMRDLVLGLEVVMPDGRVWNGLRALRKNNTGYDLRHIFVGSEGSLGVITAAVLKLFSRPQARATAWVGAASLDQLLQLLLLMRKNCDERLVAFEMLSDAALQLVLKHVPGTRAPLSQLCRFHALIELADTQSEGLNELLESSLAAALASSLIDDAVCCHSTQQAHGLWAVREGVSAAQMRAGKAVKHDIALPLSEIPAFVAEAENALMGSGGHLINFGHLGDGNLHFNVLLPAETTATQFVEQTHTLNQLVHGLVQHYQGSISAEHGVGQLRRDELKARLPQLELDLMMRIKQAFDPNQIMNPGKLL